MHAFVTDGLDPDKRAEIDSIINAAESGGVGDEKAKARRERAAVEAALRQRG